MKEESSIIIKKNLTNSYDSVKKNITNIFGEVQKESSRRIDWTYQVGVHTIYFTTTLFKNGNSTRVTTIGECDNKNTSITKVLNKFDDKLIETQPVKSNRSNSGNIESFKFPDPSPKNLLMAGLVILFLGYTFFGDPEDLSPTTYITNEGYYAAYTKKDLKRLTRFINERDEVAISELLRNGRVIQLPSNRKAFLVKSSMAIAKIRLQGNATEIWTYIEAIESHH